jgi:sodium-independent sulfate anion transporter 11
MSTIVGNVVAKAGETNPEIPPNVIASALAVIAGCIILAIGLARMGWIVDLISLTAISAFMTGSAISIAAGQVPTMLGNSGKFNTRDATYMVIINTLKYLPDASLDAAMGVTALAMLYIIRSACKYAAKKFPNHQRAFFFASTLRTVFVILLYTMISWLVNKDHAKKPSFKILKDVPRGKLPILGFAPWAQLINSFRFPKCGCPKDRFHHFGRFCQRASGVRHCLVD